MIQRIEVTSETPDLVLPVGEGASGDPIQIRNVDGLGPVKAGLAGIPYATGRGSYYQGGSIPERNLVITFGFNPNWTNQTVASLRKQVYKYFTPEKQCTLRFITDDYEPVEISGICESVEPNIFTQDPEMQVSIICHQPDFVAVDGTAVEGVMTNALDDDDPTWYEIQYDGTAPTGLVLQVESGGGTYTGPITIINETPNKLESFVLGEELSIDEEKYLLVSSIENARRVQIINYDASPLPVDILNLLAQGSDWLTLEPNVENAISVNSMETGHTFNLLYFTRYAGL